jgi:beta-N-acetylhexosaminidase
MTSHIVVPSLNGKDDTLPATLSPRILRELLREKLGFRGVIVSDALDMHALEQGNAYIAETIAAAAAGNDLLLFNHEIAKAGPAFDNLVQAARRGLLSPDELRASCTRIAALKRWLSRQPRFDLDVIRCKAHLELAREVAGRSITLVRDSAGQLPLRLSDARVAVAIPQPEDLTPADTSSYVRPLLAKALRRFHKDVDQFSLSLDPNEPEMRALVDRLSGYDLVIVVSTLIAI